MSISDVLSVNLVLFWIVFGSIGFWMGKQQGRPVAGVIVGLILGPIGLLVLWLTRPKTTV